MIYRENAIPHFRKEKIFDPKRLSTAEQISIVNHWSDKMTDVSVSQHGCSVCGCLTFEAELAQLNLNPKMSQLLTNPSAVPVGWVSPAATKQHWNIEAYYQDWKSFDHEAIDSEMTIDDHYSCVCNPVLDRNCYSWFEETESWSPLCCISCLEQLNVGKTPKAALANNYFTGTVPPCLAELTFMERLVISQLRHNFFTIDITSNFSRVGSHKYIKANAIVFSTPYEILFRDVIWPLSKQNLDKIIVCTFLGAQPPTTEELSHIHTQCYFLTIRYQHLLEAVNFLHKYNRHYQNLQVDKCSLESYKEQHIFPIHYIKSKDTNSNLEPSLAETDKDADKDGVSFVMRGVTADDISKLSSAQRKLQAINHIKNGGMVLGIGHSPELESLWNNAENWERLFSHLYPFGIGGPVAINDNNYVKSKLTHHSRVFQRDNVWLMLFYNQKEIQSVTNRARVIIKGSDFQAFADSLDHITDETIMRMNNKITMDGLSEPETKEEETVVKLCKLIGNGRSWVKGSAVEKLDLKTKLFNMTRFEGVPVFFLTYSPGDISNPITCKFVGMDINVDDILESKVPDWKERLFAVYRDPVSTERFFHYSVQCFIKCFIDGGLFGPDALYCGPVEEQGRKSLHWHLLIWLQHTETLSEIKSKLQSNNSFQYQFIQWIESIVQCGYINETVDIVAARNKDYNRNSIYSL